MKIQTTDAEVIERLRLIAQYGSVSGAHDATGVHSDTFRKAQRYAKERGLTADSIVIDEKERLRVRIEALEKENDQLRRDAYTEADIREKIFGLAERSPEPPAWLTSAIGKNGARGCPVTMWSDWHYGEVVRPEEVAGVNEFNADIAKQRVQRLVDTTVDLCFNHMGRSKTVYPGIVVALNGDIMTGEIHQELTDTNDRTNQEQINDLTDIIASALDNLAVKFGRVFVPCTVGNHGRGTLKPRTKGRVRSALEWVIYVSLERHFRGSKHVRFHVPLETDAYYRVYGHRILQTHGDSLGVRGGDGIIGAIGPIMRGSIKVGRSEAQIGRDFDTIIMGHWHQPLWLPGCIVNGSVKGYDQYARLELRAPYSRPSQQLWFTHPEHGITARWEILLDGLKRAEENAEWVTWQATT